MTRAIWAFIAFNVYSLFLISAFQENTPHLFDAKLVSEMRAAGEIFDIRAWGWKNHYIWRLFSGVVVTAIAAFLAGAIARRNAAKVTACGISEQQLKRRAIEKMERQNWTCSLCVR